MRAVVNVRHLEIGPVVLKDQLSLEEMDIDPMDPLLKVGHPLPYDLVVQQINDGILVQGTLSLQLECACSRCLKVYTHPVVIEGWMCHLPFEGEEAVPVINDLADLTPYIREDIVLAFPQRPLCEPECRGLSSASISEQENREPGAASTAWAELNKLKL